MTKKRLWTVTGLIISVYFLVYYIVTKNNTYSPGFGIESFSIALVSQVLILLIFGCFFALFISLFLSKKATFKDRLKRSFPIGISSVSIILILLAVYSKVFGNEIIRLVNYSTIEVPKDLNCHSIKNGDFKTPNFTIHRDGNKQTQINLTTQEEKVFAVDWISPCEYTLTNISDSIPTTKVKITHVTSDGYTCYVAKGEYAMLYKIKKQ